MESDFDQKVAALRGTVPAKRIHHKKKFECTPEEWAAQLNFLQERYRKDPNSVRARTARWRAANPERARAGRDLWKAQNPDRIRDINRKAGKKWQAANPEYYREWKRNRMHSDADFRMQCYLRTRLAGVMNGQVKSGSAVSNLGCTIEELWAHLESQFQPGMNRANWGKAWEVDHLFPLARVNLGRVAEFLAAVNWRNLQPLTPVQNKEKGDTITPEAQTLFNQLCQEFSHVY